MVEGMGEKPEESIDPEEHPIAPGMPVFDEDGTRLGTIRGIESGGFFVSVRDGMESLTVDHVRAGGRLGEAELMWRCMNCGEMGEIDDGLPSKCPNCGIGREDLMYWTED